MSIFNIKLKHLLFIYISFILVSIYGCGDNVSQSVSGHGIGIISDGNVGDSSNGENLKPLDDGGAEIKSVENTGHLPAHCSIVFAPVEPNASCSQTSYENCVCYNPNDPTQ